MHFIAAGKSLSGVNSGEVKSETHTLAAPGGVPMGEASEMETKT
jgi:hypothetical protein